MKPRELIQFLAVAEKLKCNTRHSYTTTGRKESVAEHSWRLALMAMLCADEYPHLDMDKVIKMCIIHDLGEAVTGDVPAFCKTDGHRAEETAAIESLLPTLPSPHKEEFGALFAEMEAKDKSFDPTETVGKINFEDVFVIKKDSWSIGIRKGEKSSKKFKLNLYSTIS